MTEIPNAKTLRTEREDREAKRAAERLEKLRADVLRQIKEFDDSKNEFTTVSMCDDLLKELKEKGYKVVFRKAAGPDPYDSWTISW